MRSLPAFKHSRGPCPLDPTQTHQGPSDTPEDRALGVLWLSGCLRSPCHEPELLVAELPKPPRDVEEVLVVLDRGASAIDGGVRRSTVPACALEPPAT